MRHLQFRPLVLALSVAAAFATPAAQAAHIKIAFIDTVSGVFASLGQNELRSYQAAIELANRQKSLGDNTLEVVAFDNKGSPQESLRQFKVATDQGFRFIVQGNGSGVALALIDAINKHNERNPGKEVVYFNHAAIDPDLTNYKCSFWHFRFDANTDMKMEALTSLLSRDQNVKKVYLINQNYAHGHQTAKAAKAMLASKRPDIVIVGDDLHPIGQVKDFSPYVAKMKAAGTDTVITGNWGADLALLVKASKEAGLKVNFYTYYAFVNGTPTAMGSAAADHVKLIGNWHPNTENLSPGAKEQIELFKKKYHDDDLFFIMPFTIVQMLSKAIKETRSTDPVKIAFAMEGMKVKAFNGDVEMRKSDHQLQQVLYIATWSKKDGKEVKYDQENTGYGWKTNQKIESYVAAQPTSCEMKRPVR
jgi:branched-chain amino acid transport system substrate-binding protein